MALSSTRVWILLASVVALGIVLVGAVAFASPENDAVNHENGKGRTLTVVIKYREAAVVDVGERGLSHGDARVVNAPLYEEGGKHKVGRIDVYCVTTDPADEPEEEASMAAVLSHLHPARRRDRHPKRDRLPQAPRTPAQGHRCHHGRHEELRRRTGRGSRGDARKKDVHHFPLHTHTRND